MDTSVLNNMAQIELGNRSWDNSALLDQVAINQHKFKREFSRTLLELKKSNFPQVKSGSDRAEGLLKEIVGCFNSELVQN